MSASKPTEAKLWLLFLLLGLAAVGWLVYWGLCVYFIQPEKDGAAIRGQFGDMFGGINALFSAFAFAGLIYTVLLQRNELALQRQELQQTREELKRSADAQVESRKVLEKQTELLTVSTSMSAWLKAQEVWTEKAFRDGRARVFARYHKNETAWSPLERDEAKEVCRRMDEIAQLAPFLGKDKILSVWSDPLAKAWFVLKPVIEDERQKSEWKQKWKDFDQLGQEAARKLRTVDEEFSRRTESSEGFEGWSSTRGTGRF